MRNLIIVVVAITFLACNSNSSIKQETERYEERFCNVLNIPDSLLQNIEPVNIVKQVNIDRRIKLTEAQRKKLFEWNPDIINDVAYLYAIKKVQKDVYLLFVLVESLSNVRFYMISVDCSTTKLDYIYFSEGDFFDVIDQNDESETGLFIKKYFQFLSDTIISIRSITKEEKRALGSRMILSSQIDSITHDYYIDRKGKFELVHRDSVRLKIK